MGIRQSVIVLVLALVGATRFTGVASATDGLLEISTDTTLTEDHDGPISIVADDVTLDCDGYAVSGYDSEEGVGILLKEVTGATVKNCDVSGAVFGILIDESYDNTIKNNVATGEFDNAFRIAGGGGNTLVGNHAEFSGSHGFELVHTSHNTLLRNTSENNHLVSENGAGFSVLEYSHANVLRDNQASQNATGLELSTNASDNTIIGNLFSDNEHGVLVIENSPGNTLIKNQLTNNEGAGFLAIFFSPDTLLVGNTLCENGEADLYYADDSEPIVKSSNEICDSGGG